MSSKPIIIQNFFRSGGSYIYNLFNSNTNTLGFYEPFHESLSSVEKLTPGGILHIDDYGICPGVKTAVDNFFSNESIWLHRVDIACRYFIKK